MGEKESVSQVALHPTGVVVSFGPFRFDRANRLLSRGTQDVPLPPRVLGILGEPRVNVGTTLEDDLRTIWSESEEKYRRAADLTFDTDGKSVEEVVAELKPAIRDYLSGS